MKAEIIGPSPIQGEVTVPGDKSISHRAALLCSIAGGKSSIKGFSPSQDCSSTLDVLKGLGVAITRRGSDVDIEGLKGHNFTEPRTLLNAGNSGTTMRLGCGLLAPCPVHVRMTGDESLSKRPMNRIIKPLNLMGADIRASNESGIPPLDINGGKLQGIEYTPEVSSAQVKSAILIAGTGASGRTTVIEKTPTRDHTELMLRHMGLSVTRGEGRVSVEPGMLRAGIIDIPGDFSSAAFLIAAGLICPGSKIIIRSVGLNPTRTGFLNVLRKMGAKIKCVVDGADEWEPRGSIELEYSELSAVDVTPGDVVSAIDEVTLIALIATQANGVTTIRGAGELRKKESDRIAGTVEGLKKMGARVSESPDGMEIEGPCELSCAELDSRRDHRLAMMWSIAGLVAKGATSIEGWEWVSISYPGFEETLNRIGVEISID